MTDQVKPTILQGMVPISLFLWLLAEIAGYMAFSRYWFNASWNVAVLGAVGGVLGLRLGIVAVTWLYAYTFASPAPKLSGWQTVKMIASEYLAFIMTFVLVIPFERLWMPTDCLLPCRRPIVLVHGFGCSRGVWWRLRRDLEAAGHTVASVSLTPPYTSIGKLVPQLAALIDQVCTATGAQQVVLIGHSMGGLVCRSFLARYGIAQVEQLITIASPHRGSELARIGFGQNAREMEPGSMWLRDLATDRIKIPFTSIRTSHDNYVMPQDNQRLPDAEDLELAGIGHLALLYSRRTSSLLLTIMANSNNNRIKNIKSGVQVT